MKKIFVLILALALLFAVGCSATEKKIVNCDNCNTEIEIDAESNADTEWIILCSECEEELGLVITEE